MTTSKAWFLYTFIRLGLFAAAYLVVWLLGGRWWLAAVIAALVSAAISILFLDKLRSKAAAGLSEWRKQDRTEDDVVEDSLIDEDALVDEDALINEDQKTLESKPDSEGDTVS